MKILRILSLLGALFGLSGCPGPNDCFLDIAGEARTETNIIIVGEQVTLRLSPQGQTACEVDEELPVPESLSVEISGPDNQPVENQATLGSPSTSSATLRFTPDKQGRYHVFAAFAPVGGIQQFDLYAARNRSSEAPVQTLPRACVTLERTRRGGLLCDSTFYRDGIPVQQLTDSRMAVSGDVVWGVSSSRIQRYVDTGTELQLTATLNQFQDEAIFLLASTDELVVMHPMTLQRITFDGEALASTGATSWDWSSGSVGPPDLRGLMLRSGDSLATISATLANGSFITLAVCPYQLQGGRFVRTEAACQLLGSEVVGFEPNVLWTGSRFTFAVAFNDLRRLEWTGGQLVEQASLPLGDTFRMTTHQAELRNTLTPVILPQFPAVGFTARPTVPVYSPERRTILLELLDTTVPDPSASPTLLWGAPSSSGTSTTVRTRPTTP